VCGVSSNIGRPFSRSSSNGLHNEKLLLMSAKQLTTTASDDIISTVGRS
jgi:hypothetical protein